MLKPANPEWREIPWERAVAAASPKVADALEKSLAGDDLGIEEGLIAGDGRRQRPARAGEELRTSFAGASWATRSPTW